MMSFFAFPISISLVPSPSGKYSLSELFLDITELSNDNIKAKIAIPTRMAHVTAMTLITSIFCFCFKLVCCVETF